MKLSILVPVYNEERTVARLLDRVLEVDLPAEREVIVVDDASTDSTPEVLERYRDRVRLLRHPANRGKGAALRTALAEATGDYVIPQDADLEYEPADIARLLERAQRTGARIVYGSRRLQRDNRQYSAFTFYLGGILVTWIGNLLFRLRLTDEPTCYKLVDRALIRRMDLQCERFEFCAEVTAKAARMGVEIVEIPVLYRPRHMGEGKKIRAKDGWETIRTFFRYLRWNPRNTK
ncbi:MAG: glycosyltransferase [Candidatus Eisenbacteria bacterium]|nr:glycosyltransferase [Candidatus Latescibacterota bacterium]MBD3303244.1 glycosyltransferase [Candidatus Eisenbacteria bacterium]